MARLNRSRLSVRRLVLAGALASAFAASCAVPSRAAEDYYRIAPKLPAPPPPPAASSVPAQGKAVGGNPQDVIVPHLNALVFVPTPGAVRQGAVTDHGIDLKITPPAPEHFASRMMPYLGRPMTKGGLNHLVQAIIVYYREHDHPVVDVAVPNQDITNGVLQVVVLEGRVGKVVIKGNRWYSNGQIRDGIFLEPGDTVDSRQLQANLDYLNQNPFRSSEIIYRPGEKLGDTDITVQTHDRFPARVFAGYEDSGDIETGIDRYFAGFNYGNLFGLSQQINYQYTTSGSFDTLRAHSGSYVIPLPWQHTLSFFGSYVDTKAQLPALLGLKGRSYQISGRYNVPLPTFSYSRIAYKESVEAGFDYKYNKDSLEFGSATAANTLYAIDQFVLGYNGAETDPWGRTTIDENLYVSPGGLSAHNDDAAFNGAHAEATSDYVYNTIVLERLTKLPEDFSLILRGTVQSSNSNLPPSEQLGLGGYDTVRGYDEREVNTDDGFIFTTEVRSPTISLGDLGGFPALKDQLQFLGFWDYGDGSNHNPLPGEPNEIPLSSLGVGFRYTINTYLSVRYDYAFQLLHTGFDNDHGSRSDIGVVISY
jgi:hemolysin activation/secretion protein